MKRAGFALCFFLAGCTAPQFDRAARTFATYTKSVAISYTSRDGGTVKAEQVFRNPLRIAPMPVVHVK